MNRFLNAGKKHIKIVAVILAAAIAFPTVGCASGGTSGAGDTVQAAAGGTAAAAAESEAAKEPEAGSAALEDPAKNAGEGSSAKVSVKEESAGAAAAEAVKQGAAASKTGSGAEKASESASKAGSGTEKSSESASESGNAAKSGSGAEENSSGGASVKEEDIPETVSVREDGGVSMNVFAMDTYMTLLAYGDKAEEAVKAAAKKIHELDEMLSTGIETSEICRINAAGGGETSEVVEELISESLEISEKTGGLFNIAIYPVMKIWGFPTQDYRVPKKAEIDKALKLADVSAIKLVTREDVEKAREAAEEAMRKAAEEAEKAAKEAAEKKKSDGTTAEKAADKSKEAAEKTKTEVKIPEVPSGPSVSFGIKGMEIDLGGIAKGYTGDMVGEIFNDYKIKSGIISLGGNVQTFGAKENGRLWRVAIQNPENDFEYLGVLDVQDKAVVTSGGYERFFEQKGVRYHHIIDPRTGYPADSGLVSATIICEEGILADGLSTSLFIMGKDKAEEFWKNSDWDFDYILEDTEGTLYVTEGIVDSLTTDANVVTVKKE